METAAVHPGNPFTALINAYRRPVPSPILFSFSLCFDVSLEFSFFCVYVCGGLGCVIKKRVESLDQSKARVSTKARVSKNKSSKEQSKSFKELLQKEQKLRVSSKKPSFLLQLQNILLAPASTKFLAEALKYMKHALDLRNKVGDLRGLRWKPLQFIPEIHLQPS